MDCQCTKCGRILKPAPAHWDGEPTYVGFFPCPCERPIQTDYGTFYPGDEEHTQLLQSGRYGINDVLKATT
jgi:hypothetical protein